jgi:hypothetical protein
VEGFLHKRREPQIFVFPQTGSNSSPINGYHSLGTAHIAPFSKQIEVDIYAFLLTKKSQRFVLCAENLICFDELGELPDLRR